jgi:hypothetical protein
MEQEKVEIEKYKQENDKYLDELKGLWLFGRLKYWTIFINLQKTMAKEKVLFFYYKPF